MADEPFWHDPGHFLRPLLASMTQETGRQPDDPADVASLYASHYDDIKRIAHVRLLQVGGAGQMHTTDLANEGFLKLAQRDDLVGDSRAQFLSYVGKVLRSVVLDHLREQGAGKRGGDAIMVTLSHADGEAYPAHADCDLEQLDRAMLHLAVLDQDLYRTLEMSAFTGLTPMQIAQMRGVSERTVQRDLVKARVLVERLIAG